MDGLGSFFRTRVVRLMGMGMGRRGEDTVGRTGTVIDQREYNRGLRLT